MQLFCSSFEVIQPQSLIFKNRFLVDLHYCKCTEVTHHRNMLNCTCVHVENDMSIQFIKVNKFLSSDKISTLKALLSDCRELQIML